MDRIADKLIGAGLCLSVCICMAGAVYAGPVDENINMDVQQPALQAQINNSPDVVSRSLGTNTKDETVYVLAGSDGSVKKIIVSDWIKNMEGDVSIADKSTLNDLEIVKGDSSYVMNQNNMLTWDAEKRDVYYQGSSKKALPVDMSVTYKLDGKVISATELAGKSGKVTIRFDYKNNQYETVLINDEKKDIYVPFAMLTGVELDDEKFSNVEVTNGKVVNDGTRTIVAGLAFPGLQQDLGIDKDKLEIPDYVEITADVKDFALGMTVTIATNDIFSNFDSDKLNSYDFKGSITELSDGMNKLLDGSSELYDGLNTLLDKSNELVEGVNLLADGAAALYDGSAALDDGAEQIKSGLAELSDGLDTLASNNSDLTGGAEQVFDSLLSTVTSQVRSAGISIPDLTISNYSDVLNGVIDSLDETNVYNQALDTVTAAVEANRDLIKQKVTEAVREQVKAKVTDAVREQVASSVTEAVREQVSSQVILAAANMSKEDYDAAVSAGYITEDVQAQINAAIDAQMAGNDIIALINNKIEEQMQSEDIANMIEAMTDEQMQSEEIQNTISENVELQIQKAISENMASDEVQSKLQAASEGVKQIISAKASLDSYNSFYLGIIQYTDGVSAASAGAYSLYCGSSELKDGTASLKDGAEALYNGVLELKDGMPALIDGVTALRDGSMELSDGLKKLNDDGIQKIIDLVEGDLDVTVENLNATIEVAKKYNNYSGISSAMDGKVKFIYRTEEI